MDENKTPAPVPYYLHESEMARMERQIKRLFILCVIMFVALIGTNAGWIWYESQYEDVVVTQEAEAEDGNIRLNGVGIGDLSDYGSDAENE